MNARLIISLVFVPEMAFGGETDQVVANAFWESTKSDLSKMDSLKEIYENYWAKAEGVVRRSEKFVRVANPTGTNLSVLIIANALLHWQDELMKNPKTSFKEGLARLEKTSKRLDVLDADEGPRKKRKVKFL